MPKAVVVGRVGAVLPAAAIGGSRFGITIASAGALFPGQPWIPTATVSAYDKLPKAVMTGVTIASIPAAPAVGNASTIIPAAVIIGA